MTPEQLGDALLGNSLSLVIGICVVLAVVNWLQREIRAEYRDRQAERLRDEMVLKGRADVFQRRWRVK